MPAPNRSFDSSGPRRSRWRRAALPAALLLLLLLYLHACVPRPIRDLRLVEIRRVSAAALPASALFREESVARGGAWWRLSFEGGSGWPEQVRRHELNGYAIAVRCDRRDAGLTTWGPFVGDVEIGQYGEGFDRLAPGDAPVLRYDVYVPEQGRYSSAADFNAPMPGYDLGRERMTLCVRIAGGAMHLAYGQSNEVRVAIGRR